MKNRPTREEKLHALKCGWICTNPFGRCSDCDYYRGELYDGCVNRLTLDLTRALADEMGETIDE